MTALMPSSQPVPPAFAANVRVMLVDDSPYFLNAAADFLRQQSGLQIAGMATSGAAALELVKRDHTDVVLLDIALGSESGLSLISPIRSTLPGVKIIVVTANDEPGYDNAALQAGADAFLSKLELTRTLIPAIFEVSGLKQPNATGVIKNRDQSNTVYGDIFMESQASNSRSMSESDALLEAWVNATELRESAPRGHALRVAAAAVDLARAWGVPESELIHIRRGALLHDIGKQAIPESILYKHQQSELSVDEARIMETHPKLARDMLILVDFLTPALDIPYCHHEHWDGSGYPRRLKGSDIPLAARLFAVVDAWDELRTSHVRHADWTSARIANELRELAGSHLDPAVVDCFLQQVANGGIDVPDV